MALVGQLLVELTGDSKAWANAVRTAGDTLAELGKEAKKTGQQIEKFNAGTIHLLSKHQNKVGELARTYKAQTGVIKKGLVEQGKAVSSNQKGIENLTAKTAASNRQLRIFSQNLKTTANHLWLMDSALKQIGLSMTAAFTVPIVGAATAAVKTFATWEKGTISIQRAAEITRQEAESITESFNIISQALPITVDELQAAGFAAAQAGVTGEEAISNFAQVAVKLSKVGGDAFKDLPIEDLSNRLAMLAIGFGETGENMENINNIASTLLAVSKAVPGGLGEVIESMRRAQGAAASYGLSLATTTALTGTLVAAGVPAARAGTELTASFHKVVQELDLVAQALGYTDDNMQELRDRIDQDMGGVLVELIERLSLTESNLTRNEAILEIFGKTGAKALQPLANNADLLNDLLARSNHEMETGALLAQEYAIQSESLAGSWQVFTNNVKALAYTIGKDLAPYLNYFLKSVTIKLQTVVAAWKNLSPPIKILIALIAGLLAVIGPLTLALRFMFIAPLSGLTTLISRMALWMAQQGAAIPLTYATSGATGVMAAAFQVAGAAVTGLVAKLAVLMGQLILVLGVVALVTVAVYALAKALGFEVKLPSIPEIKLPEYPDAPDISPAKGGEGATASTEEEIEAAKDRAKEIQKELKTKRRLRDKELRVLDRSIKDLEKTRKAEVKIRQKMVDEQKDALDLRREQWEDEKEMEQEKIDAQQDSLDITKKALKASKKILKSLTDAQDDEVTAAEQRVKLAELNLDAAQDALKREVLLGHDEFDASFRLAEERVKHWEKQVQLAKETVIKAERGYQKQIDAQEAIIDAQEEQVDVQQDALDALKDALDERKKIVDDEIEVLQDELKVRQKALDAIKDVYNEKLDILRDERDTLNDAWQDQLTVLQDQLDAAQEYSDALGDAGIDELTKQTEQTTKDFEAYSKALKDNMASIDAQMGDALKFDIGFKEGSPLGKISEYFTLFKETAEEEGKSTAEAYLAGIVGGFYGAGTLIHDALVDAVYGEGTAEKQREEAMERGQSLGQYLIDGYIAFFENLIFNAAETIGDAILGEDATIQLKAEAEQTGESFADVFIDAIKDKIVEKATEAKESIEDAIYGLLFGEEMWTSLETEMDTKGTGLAETLWGRFTGKMTELFTGLKQFIIDTIFGEGTWNELDKESEEKGTGLADMLWSGMKKKIEEFPEKIKEGVDNNIIQPIKDKFPWLFEVGEDAGEKVDEGLAEGGSDSETTGSSLIDNFVNGLRNFGSMWTVFSQIRTAISRNLGSMGGSAWSWGSNLVSSFKDGMESAGRWASNTASNIADNISRYFRSYSPPKEGPLKTIDKWGLALIKTYADSMAAGMPGLERTVRKLNETIQDELDKEISAKAIIDMGADKVDIGELEKPDIEEIPTEIKVEAPDIPEKIDVEVPEIPPVEVEEPEKAEVDIKIPDIPDVGIEAPEIPPVDVKKVEAPDVTLEAPEIPPVDVKTPETPEVEVDVPEVPPVDVKTPEIPEVKVEEPKTAPVETPEIPPIKVEEPEVLKSEVEVPDIPPVDVKEPDIEVPDVKVEKPEVSPIKVETPEIPTVKVDEPKTPEVKVPEIPPVDVEKPEVPDLKVEESEAIPVDTPEIPDVKIPDVEVEKPEVPEIQTEEVKAPEIPDVEVKEPEIPTIEVADVKVDAPEVPIIPEVEVEKPEAPIIDTPEISPVDVKLPVIPEVEVETPETPIIEVPEIPAVDVEVPGIPIVQVEKPETPTVEVDVKEPSVPDVKVDIPEIATIDVKTPDLPDVPPVEVTVPVIPAIAIEEPKLDEVPELQVDKMRTLEVEQPETPEVETSEVEGLEVEQPELPDLDVSTNRLEDAIRFLADSIVNGIIALNDSFDRSIKSLSSEINNASLSFDNLQVDKIPALSRVSGGTPLANAAADVERISPEARTNATDLASEEGARTQVVRNYNIQPGQMIATRGEVRNFVRMIKEYEEFELER